MGGWPIARCIILQKRDSPSETLRDRRIIILYDIPVRKDNYDFIHTRTW
jgi:hypothetical protein